MKNAVESSRHFLMKSMRQKQDSWVSEQEAEPVECIKVI